MRVAYIAYIAYIAYCRCVVFFVKRKFRVILFQTTYAYSVFSDLALNAGISLGAVSAAVIERTLYECTNTVALYSKPEDFALMQTRHLATS